MGGRCGEGDERKTQNTMELQHVLAHRVNGRPRWTTMEFSWALTGNRPPLVARIRSIPMLLVGPGVVRQVRAVHKLQPRGNKGARKIIEAGLRSGRSQCPYSSGWARRCLQRRARESGRRLPSSRGAFSGAASRSVPFYRILTKDTLRGRCSSSFKLGESRDPFVSFEDIDDCAYT